jgi:ligand-binding sensor domain-containing protein/signal transduction histidine kinase
VVHKDRDGILWIGTEDGLNRFDPATERFQRYFHDPLDSASICSNGITSLCEDRSGNLWIGTEQGLDKLEPGKQGFIHYTDDPRHPGGLGNDMIRCLYFDSRGRLWIGTYGGGLNVYDGTFISYQNNPMDPRSISSNYVLSVCEDSAGAIWAGTDGGGLNVFERHSGRFFSCKNKAEDPNSISNNRITSIFQDKAGGLWFGTYGGGVNLYYRKIQKFHHYKQEPNNPNSLNYNMIRGIFEDHEGILWIGTENKGLNRFDRAKNKFTHYLHDPADPYSLSYDNVRSICEDQSGLLWIGTYGGGLDKFDRTTGRFSRYVHDSADPGSLSCDKIIPLLLDRQNYLWVGTQGGGLDRFDPKTHGEPHGSHGCVHYRYNISDPYSLSNDKVWSIYEDREGTLWVGTFEGLNKFDRKTGRFTRYFSDPHDPSTLSDSWISSVCEAASGKLWVSTFNGLNSLERSTGIFTRYTKKDGLPNNTIYCMLEDTKGDLWMSTNRGLSVLHLSTGEFKNYNANDGLQSNEFNGSSFFKSKKGELFFGGINGFNAFFPDSIYNNPFVPPVVITDFKIFNKSVPIGAMPDGRSILTRSISATRSINLSYKDNLLSFEFAAINYASPEKNQYAYKMEGLDKVWNQVGNKRFITYAGLAPGKYVLNARGSNNDGVWNEEGTSLKITITPRFSQTWWFKICVLLLLTGAGVFLYELRIHFVRQKLERQKVENELKLKANFAAMLIHDLRNPLTCISGYAQFMKTELQGKYNTEPCDLIALLVHNMVELINDMLDIFKFESGKMTVKKEPVVLGDMVSGMLRLMEPLTREVPVTVKKNITVNTPVQADAIKIRRVINNLIANAIKFSPKNSQLQVTVSRVWTAGVSCQEVAVADEGSGIDQTRRNKLFNAFEQLADAKGTLPEGTGLGLAVSRLIIEAHGGTIGYRPGEGMGSVFYFRLPEVNC